ncbi:MAG TPA: hypothetical protein VGM96_27435 [Reyranella sp.]|jgi:hypothetical protein
MDANLRSRVPLEPQALKSFFQGVEHSRYDARDDFFGLNFSAQRVLSNFAWDVYSYNAYLAYARLKKPGHEPEVSKLGLHLGHLSAEQTRLLQDIFASCEEKPLDPFAFRSGYLFEPNESVHESMNRINRYFVPSARLRSDFPRILESLATEIETICGHFWRPCALRIFSVRPVPVTHSMHLDKWPLAIKKLYFYPNGVDRELGSTEMIDKQGRKLIVEGGPGTWVLFENSQVLHQALPNASKERPTIEITVVPSFETDTTLVDSGANGMFPFYPFDETLPDESVLPQEFRFAAVEHRALRRTAGLAVTLPMGDHSLGVDPYVGLNLEEDRPAGLFDRLKAWLGLGKAKR